MSYEFGNSIYLILNVSQFDSVCYLIDSLKKTCILSGLTEKLIGIIFKRALALTPFIEQRTKQF